MTKRNGIKIINSGQNEVVRTYRSKTIFLKFNTKIYQASGAAGALAHLL